MNKAATGPMPPDAELATIKINVNPPQAAATTRGRRLCAGCGREVRKEKLIEFAKIGRAVAQSPKSQKQRLEESTATPSGATSVASFRHAGLAYRSYLCRKDSTSVAAVVITTIASRLGVSEFYAADIRAGRRRPHPRHWEALAQLVGVFANA
jgi:hypothetical protein